MLDTAPTVRPAPALAGSLAYRRPTYQASIAPRRLLPRGLLTWIAGSLVFLALLQVYYISFGPNFHCVIPDQVYRSSQLSAAELQTAIPRFGLKSILNLRGGCPDQDWYCYETTLAAEHGVRHFNLNFSTYMPPHRGEFQKLVDVLDAAPTPLLIHCRQGADRTSLVAAIALLLKTDATVEEAKQQLSIRYGHAPFGKVQILDQVLVAYEGWLHEQGQPHTPDRLRHWIREIYLPGPYWAKLEPLAPLTFIKYGQWTTIPVRVTNLSRHPWQFRQAGHVGFHLNATVSGLTTGKKWSACVAGQFDHELRPGESFVLNVALPPIRQTGPCRLFIDMEDEQWCIFHMVGSPPINQELMVLPWPLRPPSR